jgi:hypothetical protein
MKNLLTGLLFLISLPLIAQPWQTIKGNGETKKEIRTVSNFTSLSSQGSMNVQISYGNSTSVTVEADENLLPYIETTVEDGRLIIRPKKNVNLTSRSKMTVYVSMTQINSLKLSGSGNINGSGAFSNEGKTDISVSGSGNLALSFDKFNDLDLSVSGSGNIDIKGNGTHTLSAQVSGSGNIDCSNTSSNDVQAKISGSGNVKVYATNSIDAKISGSGNVFYKGTVTNISSKASGSGKVLKM